MPDMDPNAVLPKRSFLPNELFSHLHIEAFSCISKFTGALLCWFSHGNLQKEVCDYQCNSFDSSKNLKRLAFEHPNFSVLDFRYGSKDIITPGLFGNISKFTIHHFVNEAERLPSCSVLSLAAALIPSFNVMSANGLALPLGSNDVQLRENIEHRTCQENIEHSTCQVGREEYSGLSFQKLDWTRQTVEPRTGIEFPMLLKKNASRSNSEKLGSKYASIPASKLDKCDDLYKDLLREDIVMSVRLVVNYNGLKINTVRDVFEKSLRARLVKANPRTDFSCLNDFGSFFTQDIPIPAGTIIDFRRTADGQLITEIGGNLIGAVRSKDLCRAFFGMYIGDVPVSEQTKEEIGRKVVGIIKRC